MERLANQRIKPIITKSPNDEKSMVTQVAAKDLVSNPISHSSSF
jgi:hypothetical protein